MREISYTVPAEFDGVQAQVFLKSRGISRRVLTALKRSGGLTRGGGILRTVDAVHAGEVITLQLDGGETSVAANPELSADIVYEDEDVVVFNKPPFMPVHPSQRHHDDTLANLFAARYPGLPFRADKPPGPQHQRTLRVREESVRSGGAFRQHIQSVLRDHGRNSPRGHRGRADRQTRGQRNRALRDS